MLQWGGLCPPFYHFPTRTAIAMKPKALASGATLGIFSPSAPSAHDFPHRLRQAEENADRALGLKAVYGRTALMKSGWTSATPRERVRDFEELLERDDVQALVASIGGDHSAQMLSYVDWDKVRKQKKIIMGASDAGLVSLAAYVKTGLITFYGPTWVASFGEYPELLEYTKMALRQLLFSPEPYGRVSPARAWTEEFLDWTRQDDMRRPRALVPNDGPRWIRPGSAEGPFIGGTLESLDHLRGTSYWPNWEGALFFFELSEEIPSPERVDAILGDYANMGVFEQISGVLVGRLYRYPEDERETLFDVIRRWTEPARLPVLAECDFGHTDPVFPIPIGACGRIDGDGWHVLEGAVE